MAFGSKPPARRARVTPWDLLKLDGMKPWKGWLAGPPIWLATHHFGRTLPCVSDLTDGGLKCPLSHKEFVPRWRAYVPLWDETGARVFTVVCDRYQDQLDKLPHLCPVLIAKQPMKGKPIKIWEAFWTRSAPQITSAAQKPQDIRPYLVILWARPEIADWFSSHPMGPLPEQARRAVVLEDSISEPIIDGKVDRLRDRTNDAFAEAARKVSANGRGGH